MKRDELITAAKEFWDNDPLGRTEFENSRSITDLMADFAQAQIDPYREALEQISAMAVDGSGIQNIADQALAPK
jgi:hypothetical protein